MKNFITGLVVLIMFATSAFGFGLRDAQDNFLEEIQKPFEGVRGKLVARDTEQDGYYILIDGVFYMAELDDGRSSTLRAQKCLKVSVAISPGQLEGGCDVTFSGQGQRDDIRPDLHSSVFFMLILWDVEFH